jgi:hypothetical protein
MRYTHYYRRLNRTGEVDQVVFYSTHYDSVGLKPQAGMPVLEAHELVNRFNRESNGTFTYFLEESR